MELCRVADRISKGAFGSHEQYSQPWEIYFDARHPLGPLSAALLNINLRSLGVLSLEHMKLIELAYLDGLTGTTTRISHVGRYIYRLYFESAHECCHIHNYDT